MTDLAIRVENLGKLYRIVKRERGNPTRGVIASAAKVLVIASDRRACPELRRRERGNLISSLY